MAFGRATGQSGTSHGAVRVARSWGVCLRVLRGRQRRSDARFARRVRARSARRAVACAALATRGALRWLCSATRAADAPGDWGFGRGMASFEAAAARHAHLQPRVTPCASRIRRVGSRRVRLRRTALAGDSVHLQFTARECCVVRRADATKQKVRDTRTLRWRVTPCVCRSRRVGSRRARLRRTASTGTAVRPRRTAWVGTAVRLRRTAPRRAGVWAAYECRQPRLAALRSRAAAAAVARILPAPLPRARWPAPWPRRAARARRSFPSTRRAAAARVRTGPRRDGSGG